MLAPRVVPLDACLIWLRDPASYPDRPTTVESVETSLSWVFLTDYFAYKLKKPVRHPLVDLTTLASRKANAEAEVQLNRRLAPGVYLAPVALTVDETGALRLDRKGEVVDWLVKMYRLPKHYMLDRLLKARQLPFARLRALADRLAHFYAQAPTVALSGPAYRARLGAEMAVNQQVLNDRTLALPRQLVKALHTRLFTFLERETDLLDERAEGGRLVEGHGDLRPEHVCLLKPPLVFDCLEFDRRLRELDPLDDLAFLAVACERQGVSFVGETLYDAYRLLNQDRAPQRLVEFYCSYRASLRARLAAAHALGAPLDAGVPWLDRAMSYLKVAEQHAENLGCDSGIPQRK